MATSINVHIGASKLTGTVRELTTGNVILQLRTDPTALGGGDDVTLYVPDDDAQLEQAAHVFALAAGAIRKIRRTRRTEHVCPGSTCTGSNLHEVAD